MFWAMIVLVCVFLAIKFRGFRFGIAAILGLVVLAVTIFVGWQHESEEHSKHLVKRDQLLFTDLRLGQSNYGSSYVLTGRVRNNSQFTVFDVKAKIRILDCEERSHCEVVGEEEAWNISPLLPSGQVRSINSDIFFGSGTQVRGNFQWSYEITEIRARAGD
jgi:hypothetical protein